MPDCTDQDPGKEFERNVAALARPRVHTKGGIISPDNYKSFVVNIRPTKWPESIWIGQIDNYVDAQFIADLVYYYIGRPCFHLQNVSFHLPPLDCKDTSTPLTSREMCFEYAVSIANKDLKSQRKEFIKSVKKLAVEEVKRVEVQRVLQQFRDVIVGKHEEEEDQSHQSMEVDGPKHLPVVLASHEGVTRNVDGLNAHVLGFDMGDTGSSISSALTPVEECSWAKAYLAGMKDYDGSPNHDAEDFCSATGVLEENSCDCHLAYENFAVNFFAMEDTFKVYETGESSSNFLIDLEGGNFVSDSHFTHMCTSDESSRGIFHVAKELTHYNGLDASIHPEVMHDWLSLCSRRLVGLSWLSEDNSRL